MISEDSTGDAGIYKNKSYLFSCSGQYRKDAGGSRLSAVTGKEEWKLEKGGRYYTERNDSSVIAFVIPEKEVGIRGFHMAAAHSDSPCFKIKEKPELTVEEHYLRLNTENTAA